MLIASNRAIIGYYFILTIYKKNIEKCKIVYKIIKE